MSNEENAKKLANILSEAQTYFTENRTGAMADTDFDEETYLSYINDYLDKEMISYDKMTQAELQGYLYNELKGYSILEKYLKDPQIEEINVNSWRSIKLHYSDGRILNCNEHFLSPDHAYTIVSRMIRGQNSGVLMDRSEPIVRGHLGKHIRITASQAPILDEDSGVQVNIRKINPLKLSKEDFIRYGTATEEIYDFLLGCFTSGLSVLFVGSTNTGKTTMMSSLLRLIDPQKRLITIENEVREFDLVVEDENSDVVNSVIHWKTTNKFDQERLLEMSLTSNPDYICLSEMKDKEADAVQEASRTGHSVTTTIHANSCRAAYPRMTTLCLKKGSKIGYDILYELCAEAFPIAVFMSKLEDHSRKIMEITECLLDENRRPQFKTLFQYKIKEAVKMADGKTEIDGHFEQVNEISDKLKDFFLASGYSANFLKGVSET